MTIDWDDLNNQIHYQEVKSHALRTLKQEMDATHASINAQITLPHSDVATPHQRARNAVAYFDSRPSSSPSAERAVALKEEWRGRGMALRETLADQQRLTGERLRNTDSTVTMLKALRAVWPLKQRRTRQSLFIVTPEREEGYRPTEGIKQGEEERKEPIRGTLINLPEGVL